jgi:hypothetical protein
MSVSKSNGVPGNRRRRRGPVAGDPAAVGTTAPAEAPAPVPHVTPGDVSWVARLDDLAVALADLHDRGTIIDRVVREALSLLPAENVVIRPEAPEMDGVTVASGDGAPDRAVIPLAAGGRRFGALELQVKAGRRLDAAQRTLLVALGRQSALALDRASVAAAQRETLRQIAASRVVGREAIDAALERVATGVRALAHLARSSALPSAASVAEAERLAQAHLDELRRAIGIEIAASPPDAAPASPARDLVP